MSLTSTFHWLPSFRNVLLISATLRVVLIVYSEWHDAHSVVKYTDVDYRVFSDAARFILHPGPGNIAKGPLQHWLPLSLGDPYSRDTYRYTPLLALLLVPNEWIHASFGKYLFAVCDIVNGVLIYKLLLSVILPSARARQANSSEMEPVEIHKTDGSPISPRSPDPDVGPTIATRTSLATFYSALHLLNPLVFSISTRGSSESVLSTFVLLTLYFALKGRWDAAAILLGISAHWKIYPIIYGVACLGVITSDGKGHSATQKSYLQQVVNWKTVWFGVLSAGTFITLGACCYAVWGYPFLYESYLYHLHRLDHRHNFSPYFYLTYLTYPTAHSPDNTPGMSLWTLLLRSPLTSFVPQMSLALGSGLVFGRRKEDLLFTWFVQTVVFVLFNKVCTSQYFLWYLLFLPLLLPRITLSRRVSIVYVLVWIGTQALWLSEAYRLEFLGRNVFYTLWSRSLVYVVGNSWVLVGLMNGYYV